MMNKKRLFSLLVVAGLAIGVSGGAYYSGALNLDFNRVSSTSSETVHNTSFSNANHNADSIIDHSDAIIRGKVVNVSDFQENSDAYYRTQNISVEVEEILKGNIIAGSTINVQINSYQGVQNVNVALPEYHPEFSKNEDVVIFLVEHYDDYIISGVNQGAFYLDTTSREDGENFKHKTRIGNDFEKFNYSQLLEKLQ